MSVYFAHAGDYTKIGYSKHPIRRAATITTNGKRPDCLPRGTGVDIVGWVPGDVWREAEIQARFIDRRVAGEWFRRIDDDLLRDLIWSDPRGIDLYRMSSSAVLYAIRNPEKTRDEIEAVTPVIANAYWELRA